MAAPTKEARLGLASSSVPAAAAMRLGHRLAHSSRAGLCMAGHSWQQGYGAPRAALCGLSTGSMAMPGMGLPHRALHHTPHGGAAWAAGRCSRLSPFLLLNKNVISRTAPWLGVVNLESAVFVVWHCILCKQGCWCSLHCSANGPRKREEDKMNLNSKGVSVLVS